jgi:hypothetical protein
MKRYIYVIAMLGIFLLSFSAINYREATYSLTAILLLMILDRLGKGIVLREFVAFFTTLTCLIMPILGYTLYTRNNFLSRYWVKFMPVSENIYYNFSFPAVCLFCIAICLPLPKSISDDGDNMKKGMAKILQGNGNGKKGLIILIVGGLASLIEKSLPGGLQFFANLIYISSFSGFLYLFYAKDFPYRKLILTVFSLFIIYKGISSGMFTIIAYMGITLFSILIFGKQNSIVKKVAIFSMALLFFVILQNTKRVYRRMVWEKTYSGNQFTLFGKIFLENIQKGEVLFEKDEFFPIYARANQGYNVAMVMKRIPAIKDFDNGSRLAKVFLSAFVPRFLWPDKPEAGGKFNMEYYAGFRIKGFSTNVGPLGEAYGSFGVIGGIFYMVLLGAFIRWFYGRVFKLAVKYPLLILWIPVLFFQVTYSAENDTLQIINSLLKASLYIYILFKLFPSLFISESNLPKLKSGSRNEVIQVKPDFV